MWAKECTEMSGEGKYDGSKSSALSSQEHRCVSAQIQAWLEDCMN